MYTGKSYKDIVASKISRIDETTNEEITGVELHYGNGPACLYGGGPTSFTIKSWCNMTLPIEDTKYSGFANGTDPCNAYIEIESSIGACDILSNNLVWQYLAYIEPYIGVIGIVGGFILAFYGFRLLKPTIFAAGFLACCAASMLIFYAAYANSVDELEAFYIWLGVGAGVGLIVGYLLQKVLKVGAAFVAGWGGLALGLILNEAVMWHFEYVWVFWTTNIVCMIVAAVLAFKYFEHIFIYSSSIMGSYFLIRGVSVYAGHYYNEFTVIKLLKAGLYDEIDPYYWGYVGGFVAIALIGAWYQFRNLKPAKPAHPYHH